MNPVFLYSEDEPAGKVFTDPIEYARAIKSGWRDSPPHMWKEEDKAKAAEKQKAAPKRKYHRKIPK